MVADINMFRSLMQYGILYQLDSWLIVYTPTLFNTQVTGSGLNVKNFKIY
jgi:hypothetical protein